MIERTYYQIQIWYDNQWMGYGGEYEFDGCNEGWAKEVANDQLKATRTLDPDDKFRMVRVAERIERTTEVLEL